MTYLPTNGYKQLIISLVVTYSLGIITSVSGAMMKDALTMELLGQAQNTLISTLVACLIRSAIFFTLNYIYFGKRQIIFDEVIDYEEKKYTYIGSIDTCPHCGADVPDDQMFCVECGKNFDYVS